MTPFNLKALVCAGLTLLASQGAYAQHDEVLLRPLVESAAQRLAIAHDVALSKWDSGTSVEDPAREAVVVSKAVAEGEQSGLTADDVTRFFKAQIEANKVVQYGLLAKWRRIGYAPTHTPIDLVGTIRPELDALQTKLIAGLVDAKPVLEGKDCATEVAHAVGRYAFEHQYHLSNVPLIELDRAMAGFCRVY